MKYNERKHKWVTRLDKNDQQLLAEAQQNLQAAKKELAELEQDDQVAEEIKKLAEENYRNAQVNAQAVAEMVQPGGAASVSSNQPASPVAPDDRSVHAKPSAPQPEPAKSTTVALPSHDQKEKIEIHFPDSNELRSAISYSNARRENQKAAAGKPQSAVPARMSAARPAPKVSTREALREAAVQTFIGTGKGKPAAANEDSRQEEKGGMTREEYRKLHNQNR